jgi:hypothetical protein
VNHPTLDELPDILTIHEVADYMRVSTNAVQLGLHRCSLGGWLVLVG